MAESTTAAGEQHRQRRKLARGLLTCFCSRRTQQLRSASTDEDGDEMEVADADHAAEGTARVRRRRPSTYVVDKPLRKIADAFKELANVVTSDDDNSHVDVAGFSRACSYVAVLFGCVGFHFKFIEMDYVTKVNDLADASKTFQTLQSMVDQDVQTNTVRKQGSHSRNLLKIKRGLDFLRLLFEQILLTEGNSIRDAVSKAYTQIFQSHHGWALRKAVSARVHHIPTKQQLYRKLNEDGAGADAQLRGLTHKSPHSNLVRSKGPNASLCNGIPTPAPIH